MVEAGAGLALQRLLQLASPSLPVGAFAYSEGLETAVARGDLDDRDAVADWLSAVFEHTIVPVDLAVSLRLHAAWSCSDMAAVREWSAYLLATRETAERRAQERHLGHAMANLLNAMGETEAGPWRLGRDEAGHVSFAALWSLAAARWGVSASDAAAALGWTWLENQTLAAVKLVPLGQTDGQRLLFELSTAVPEGVARAASLPDTALGGSLPGLALASTEHETLYSRLYRS